MAGKERGCSSVHGPVHIGFHAAKVALPLERAQSRPRPAVGTSLLGSMIESNCDLARPLGQHPSRLALPPAGRSKEAWMRLSHHLGGSVF